MNRDIVAGHACLLGNLDDLDLDVDLNEALAERVHLDETGIHGLVELAEFGDQANVALLYALIRVGAADAARHGAESANQSAQAID